MSFVTVLYILVRDHNNLDSPSFYIEGNITKNGITPTNVMTKLGKEIDQQGSMYMYRFLCAYPYFTYFRGVARGLRAENTSFWVFFIVFLRQSERKNPNFRDRFARQARTQRGGIGGSLPPPPARNFQNL